MNRRIDHKERGALSRAVADAVADCARRAVADRGEARLALSGGSTPVPAYEMLSRDETVPWDRVVVTLADERITPPGHADSNETLLRRTLLKDRGAAASFEPLDTDQQQVPRQDLVLLGMGSDGHFASLFPNAEALEAALAPEAPAVLRIEPDPLPENAPYPRLSLSLRAILEARTLVLAITGQDKRSVLERAAAAGPDRDLPIRALLKAGHPDFTIHWAP